MIVVLDTTAFSSDFMCSGTAWRVLAHANKAWGLQIRVPEVVVAEAIGGYEREIGNTCLAVDKIVTKYAGRLGLRQHFGDFLEGLQERRNDYPELLAQMIEDLGGSVLPPPEVSHMELAKRAASRRKPCDHKGDGYRDTLNWLLVLEIAQSNPEETVYWVTDNTGDFTNEEKTDLHEDLLEDLRDAGAAGRVHWSNDLSTLILSLAGAHYDESSDDLRKVRDSLQRGAVTEFISVSVLPGVVKRSISPRRCGLPVNSLKPEILAVQGEPEGLELDVKGVAEQGGAFAEFSFTAEALVGLDLVDGDGELPEGFERGDGVDRSATVLKQLSFRGLIELDSYGRPVSGEVSNIDALNGDPGLDPWKSHGSSLASVQAALARFHHRNLVDPALLEALQETLRPKIDPKIFGPLIDPKVIEMLRPKIDAKMLGPLIDPKVIEMLRPKIDPKIFSNLLPSFNAIAGMADSSAFAAALHRGVEQADLDDDDDVEEDDMDDEGNEDESDV
ncbi:PIN domain-containing protein [Streptomyces sp. NPDC090085]|uniref:PIN domain-containing protein n=1 Tax=Streptomyces sp. NPDC090085 TaxID=3365943 RepID=UPI003821BE7F